MRLWPFGKKAAAREYRHGGPALMQFGSAAPEMGKMRREIDHGLAVSSVMAVVQWLQRAIVEPDLELYRVTDDGEEVMREHDALSLLARPNPFYSGDHLLAATLFSWVTGGNGYWIKVAAQSGGPTPVELWYAPHWMMTPDYPRDGSSFLSQWKYNPGTGHQTFAPDEVVHFRHGIDPKQPRLGISPIHSALRECWTDMDAIRFVSQMLENNAVPGLVLGPKYEDQRIEGDATELKAEIRAKFRGAQRGDAMVMTAPTDVHQLKWDPKALNVGGIRNMTEERLCALLGIHAAVIGFGSGMEQTQVGATLGELRKMSWQNGLVPVLNAIASELDRSIGPDFGLAQDGWRFRFCLDDIESLQEDRGALVTRVTDQFRAGIITRAKAKELLGHDVEADDDVYLLPLTMQVIPRGAPPAQGAPEPEQRSAPAPSAKSATERDVEREKSDAIREQFGCKHGHDHTPFEMRMVETAPRATRIPAQAESAMDMLDAVREDLERLMADDLVPVFEDMGRRAESAAREVLDQKDELDTDRILEAMAVATSAELMADVFRQSYMRTAQSTNGVLSATIGIGTDLPDPVAQAVLQTGGRRAGLIDLSAQSRRRIFDAITELRQEGAGVPEIARRIREDVARGPWSSPRVRAEVIARTEVKFAQNASTIERAKVEGITHALIFDARLGPTDEVCMALDGRIVTLQEAEQLMFDEHPNGTRSFTPLPPALHEEVMP